MAPETNIEGGCGEYYKRVEIGNYNIESMKIHNVTLKKLEVFNFTQNIKPITSSNMHKLQTLRGGGDNNLIFDSM